MLVGLIFLKVLLLWFFSTICTQVNQMAGTLKTVAWWFGQFLYIVRRTPHPEPGPPCEFRLCHAFTASRRRPASTLTSASPADQLRHVSWTEGFASASQPLPASLGHRFIAHQAMGVRIDSRFWESLFFGMLQQINQVLLILTIFACWVYFS